MSNKNGVELLRGVGGAKLAIPIVLCGYFNNVAEAAFLSQAAFLSASSGDGWFHLPTEAESGKKLKGQAFESWAYILGLSGGRQVDLRKRWVEGGLLCELPTISAIARGEQPRGSAEKALVFTQKRGAPPRVYYRVNLHRYVDFLTKLVASVAHPDGVEEAAKPSPDDALRLPIRVVRNSQNRGQLKEEQLVDEKKEKEAESGGSAAVAFDQKIRQLEARAAGVKNRREDTDAHNVDFLINMARTLGPAAVLDAIQLENFPAGAVRAARSALGAQFDAARRADQELQSNVRYRERVKQSADAVHQKISSTYLQIGARYFAIARDRAKKGGQ